MESFLLYEADCYHYVLITKLAKKSFNSEKPNSALRLLISGIFSGCVKKALQSLANIKRPAVKMRLLLLDD